MLKLVHLLNRSIYVGASVCLCTLLATITPLAQSSQQPSTQMSKPSASVSPSAMIEKIIRDYFQVLSDFSRNGNTDAIMGYYTPSYNEVDDGQFRSSMEIRREWQDRREKMNLGKTNMRSISILSIETMRIFDSTAQVVLTFEEKYGSQGSVKNKYTGVCSYFLVRQPEGGRWLIDHEHCSRKKK